MTQSYAIVETGGKQYKVSPGQKIDVDRLKAAGGADIELSRVLLIADDKDTKVRYRRKKGHRQIYSRLEIKEIVKPGGETSPAKATKKKAAAGGNS
jgi:ribosomal protein L21